MCDDVERGDTSGDAVSVPDPIPADEGLRAVGVCGAANIVGCRLLVIF